MPERFPDHLNPPRFFGVDIGTDTVLFSIPIAYFAGIQVRPCFLARGSNSLCLGPSPNNQRAVEGRLHFHFAEFFDGEVEML